MPMVYPFRSAYLQHMDLHRLMIPSRPLMERSRGQANLRPKSREAGTEIVAQTKLKKRHSTTNEAGDIRSSRP